MDSNHGGDQLDCLIIVYTSLSLGVWLKTNSGPWINIHYGINERILRALFNNSGSLGNNAPMHYINDVYDLNQVDIIILIGL